jgi:hypothetical protein
VTGCLTQRYGADIMREMPEIDGILGTSDLPRIVDLVRQAAAPRLGDGRAARLSLRREHAAPAHAKVPYAYVKIAEGCDMGCTFCAIPQFRGKHRSRPLADIVREVEGSPRARAGGDPRLAGHARVRARPAGQRRHRRSAPRARRDADAVDPPDVSPSRAC